MAEERTWAGGGAVWGPPGGAASESAEAGRTGGPAPGPASPESAEAGPLVEVSVPTTQAVPLERVTQAQARDLVTKYRAEHEANPRVWDDPAWQLRWATLQSRAFGYTAEEGQPIIGEQHGWRLREPGTAALAPAPRPELSAAAQEITGGWDEAALVLAETEAHACDLPP
jgi:hypothetical protein